eukprot:184781_1
MVVPNSSAASKLDSDPAIPTTVVRTSSTVETTSTTEDGPSLSLSEESVISKESVSPESDVIVQHPGSTNVLPTSTTAIIKPSDIVVPKSSVLTESDSSQGRVAPKLDSDQQTPEPTEPDIENALPNIESPTSNTEGPTKPLAESVSQDAPVAPDVDSNCELI